MANISHFTQTVNGVSTTYDIHDANAVPRSGGAVMTGPTLSRTVDNNELRFDGGSWYDNGASLSLSGKDRTNSNGFITLHTTDGTNKSELLFTPNGTFTRNVNGTVKNIAMYEDVIPRSGGAVMTGNFIGRIDASGELIIGGGDDRYRGGGIAFEGIASLFPGAAILLAEDGNSNNEKRMFLYPDGTWTWDGTACQITSDQRLKQQIAEIDDKLLDAWEDVDLVQFKYNDAVDTKKDKARLHTGYVVQQIDKACKSHDVDISDYGLYCHEEYPEETEEVEVEQADGTKTKETKVIREASEHYSLRYTEVYAVECMYLRRCIARLTARFEQLEKDKEQEAG